jgi:hypothetical protein
MSDEEQKAYAAWWWSRSALRWINLALFFINITLILQFMTIVMVIVNSRYWKAGLVGFLGSLVLAIYCREMSDRARKEADRYGA